MKVGDRYIVRSWKSMEEEFGLDFDGDIPMNQIYFTSDMREYCGKMVTVDYVLQNGFFRIKEDRNLYSWTEEMVQECKNSIIYYLQRRVEECS